MQDIATQPRHQFVFKRWKSWHVFVTLLALPTIQGHTTSDKTAQVKSPASGQSRHLPVRLGWSEKAGCGPHTWKNSMIEGEGQRESWVIEQVPKGILQVSRASVWVQNLEHTQPGTEK